MTERKEWEAQKKAIGEAAALAAVEAVDALAMLDRVARDARREAEAEWVLDHPRPLQRRESSGSYFPPHCKAHPWVFNGRSGLIEGGCPSGVACDDSAYRWPTDPAIINRVADIFASARR